MSTSTRSKWSKPEDGRVFREIRIAEGLAQEQRAAHRTVAFPERHLPVGGGLKEYQAARKQGARHLVLWADPYRHQVYAQVVTRSAAKGQSAVFEVLGAAGESLAVIQRDPAARGGTIRTRWTVRQTGRQPAVGRKGHPVWWALWWLISPIQLAIVIASVLGGGDVARTPRRTKWRIDGETVLDWANGFGDFGLEAPADWWDPRVTASLVALLTSHDSWLGNAWDTRVD
ncbi:hypothetical protein LRS74_31500 [Streptomyces sp. LX-29]|uniref:hypothetical protein n=1 Tax=Streptomyces sp. LX-29 TaxID=2900152 RepID=UPI00240CEAD9|nr:hypothetical protein [Streptomyces sp. LX-29]WFB11064.1 hypothetical protein LRS74_31500 [Streptomyces sp. LX-29]